MKKRMIIGMGLACLTAGIGIAGCGASSSQSVETTTAIETTTTQEPTTTTETTTTTEAATTTTTQEETTSSAPETTTATTVSNVEPGTSIENPLAIEVNTDVYCDKGKEFYYKFKTAPDKTKYVIEFYNLNAANPLTTVLEADVSEFSTGKYLGDLLTTDGGDFEKQECDLKSNTEYVIKVTESMPKKEINSKLRITEM